MQLLGGGIRRLGSTTRPPPVDVGRARACAPHRNMHTHACAHTRTNQFSPACRGGFGYRIRSQRLPLSRSACECRIPAFLLPFSAQSQKNTPPLLPPFPARLTQKAKTDPSSPLQLGRIRQDTHTRVGHGNAAQHWVGKSTGGGAGQQEEQGWSLFFFLSLLLSALLERKRKKDYSSFSIK